MKVIEGNLVDITAGIIVHGCNCQGVMGSGVALAIKGKYPGVFKAYEKLWNRDWGLKLGQTQFCLSNEYTGQYPEGYEVWRGGSELPKNLIVVNAMTQFGYGKDGSQYVDYNAVRACFSLVAGMAEHTALPVYFPKIGAGLGGGDWAILEKIIEQALINVGSSLIVLPEKVS